MSGPTAGRRLVPTHRIEGTDVYSALEGKRIGRIHHLVIDLAAGKVAYADMSFGGFLGIGETHYPIPWRALSYDGGADVYVTGITESQLKSAPRPIPGIPPDRGWEERLHEHYGVPAYWPPV